MNGGKVFEQIQIDYRNFITGEIHPVYLNIYQSSLAEKWLVALNELLNNNYHLEKNYCFMGWLENQRNGEYILDQVNKTIAAINQSSVDYYIDDYFTLENTISEDPVDDRVLGRNLIHNRMNQLHRYFEDTQGVSGAISPIAQSADPATKWHIRQLNLLCHEFESWALSYRKEIEAPEWLCPSQLMCWLNAPRFELEDEDYDLFGVETISRPTGAVYVGVNKAVGKHHWEVFQDEGRDSRIDELTTTTLRSQTEAAGDFDIEWGRSAEKIASRQRDMNEFRSWLKANGFDPDDKKLTIGHPQIGSVDFNRSFGTGEPSEIWSVLGKYLDVYRIKTSDAECVFDYHWSDADFIDRQIRLIN